MKSKQIYLLITVIMVVVFFSCKKDKTEEPATFTTTPYTIAVPAGFPPVGPNAANLTIEGVALGRMLYYDPILSSNGLSCSSCHKQSKSFSSPFHVHPNGDTTSIPSHINLAWKNSFLWEGGLSSIENVCMGDFEPEFFNTNMNDLVNSLMAHDQYPAMFKSAFNVSDISALSHQQLKEYIVNATAQFANTFVSSNSRYDQFQRHEIMMTPDEQRGYIIFNTEEGDCFHCHGSVLCTDNKWHNNGLDANPAGQAMGYYNFSHDTNDIGKFLAPTLRNVEFTAPYMHDGRFQTLEQVVEFYNSGVNLNSPNVDPIMTKPFKLNGLHLSVYDKQCLVLFLKMFSDTNFINNPDYSSPF